MRDNRNMEELTDRAWAGMKELLDREMPVAPQRKHRPLIWWWMSSAAAVLLLAAGFLLLRDAPQEAPIDLAGSLKTEPGTEITANETSRVPEIVETEELTVASSITATAAEELSPQSERAAAEPGAAAVAALPRLEKDPSIPAIEEVAGPIDPTVQPPAGGIAAAAGTPAETAAAGPPAKENPAGLQTPELEFTFEAIDLEKVPRLAFHPLEIPAMPFDQEQEYNPKKPLFTPLEVQAGMISREPVNANGFFAGMRSGLRLGASGKWSVQSGIGVQAQQHPFVVSHLAGVDFLESQGNPGTGSLDQNGGNNSVKADLPTQIAQSGIELHALYLDVPLLLQWQFSRKWALEAGPRLSWRLASRWEYSDSKSTPAFSAGGNGSVSLNAGDYSRQLYFVSASAGSQQPVYLVLQDLYAAGSGGISYLLRPGWRLRFQYQHSVSNLLDSDIYQSTDRSFRLSLGIRF